LGLFLSNNISYVSYVPIYNKIDIAPNTNSKYIMLCIHKSTVVEPLIFECFIVMEEDTVSCWTLGTLITATSVTNASANNETK